MRAYPEEDVLALFDDRIDASDVGIVACLKNYFETTSKMLQDAQYNEYVGDFPCFSWLFFLTSFLFPFFFFFAFFLAGSKC